MLNPGDPELIEAVDAHIAQHIAPVHTVFDEIVSPDLHYRRAELAARALQVGDENVYWPVRRLKAVAL